MQLILQNSETTYDLSKWVVDFSGMRFRTSFNDRFGQPGQEPQGDGKESARSIVFTYSVDSETDSGFILDAETLYASVRGDLGPFYIVDSANGRRLKVTPTDLDLTPKAGTELRYASARLGFQAVDTFWEASTATEVDSGTAALDNQETLECTNAGVITIYPIITVTPDESNQTFAIFNDTTEDVFTFSSASFVPGSVLEIDCQNGTVYLTNVTTVTEVSNGIADGTGFLHLVPGLNSLRYESAYGAVTMTVSFRRRWPF
jgi:hypothetical protein